MLQRYIVEQEPDWRWFTLCGKYMHESHASSDMHRLRLEETAAVDEMVGICTSLRRFSPTAGLTTGLNAKDFKLYWGERIDEMPKILLGRVNSGTSIKIPLSGWGKNGWC